MAASWKWQLWQVGAAVSSGSILLCLSRNRTPCFDDEYISHCGWSIPMWHVLHACGDLASSAEKRCRLWQTSHDDAPKPAPFSIRSRTSPSVLSPTRWQPPQPFRPSIWAIGCQCTVGMAFIAAHARACFPFANWSTWVSWHCAHVSGKAILAPDTSVIELCPSP